VQITGFAELESAVLEWMAAHVPVPNLREQIASATATGREITGVGSFPASSFRPGSDDKTIAVFPALDPEIGSVTIWDDGDEATVIIGKITHGHFNPYDESLSESERVRRVTEEVVGFLADLFSDRVLLWTEPSGRSGGWKMLRGEPPDRSHRRTGDRRAGTGRNTGGDPDGISRREVSPTRKVGRHHNHDGGHATNALTARGPAAGHV
jgi:hypothetical protein